MIRRNWKRYLLGWALGIAIAIAVRFVGVQIYVARERLGNLYLGAVVVLFIASVTFLAAKDKWTALRVGVLVGAATPFVLAILFVMAFFCSGGWGPWYCFLFDWG